jgi:hypothetical protein
MQYNYLSYRGEDHAFSHIFIPEMKQIVRHCEKLRYTVKFREAGTRLSSEMEAAPDLDGSCNSRTNTIISSKMKSLQKKENKKLVSLGLKEDWPDGTVH